MNRLKLKKVCVALVAVVVIVAVSNSMCVKASASGYIYTVDDLRDLVGLQRHNSKEYAAEIINFADEIGVYDSDEELKELKAFFQLKGNLKTGFEEVQEGLNNAVEYLRNAIGNGLSAESVFYAINQVEYYTSKSKEYYNNKVDIAYEYDNSTKYGVFKDDEEIKEFIENYKSEYNRPQFTIGELGNGLRPYTENLWYLVDAFGNNKKGDVDVVSNYITNENITNTNINIVAQFHGNVESIMKDSEDTYEIVIKHGEDVRTTYTGVSRVAVTEGVWVSQYEKIGELKSKRRSSLKLVVDNIMVNPLLIYGAEGVYEFYRLVNENPGIEFDDTFLDIIKNEPSMENLEGEAEIVKLDESAVHLVDDRVTYGTSFYDNN